MPNAAKPGPEPLLADPEAAPEAIVDPAEASETAVRRLSGGPALNARFGDDLQSATPKPSDHRARSGALRLIPGPTPRRRIASGRSPTGQRPPPLPRPS